MEKLSWNRLIVALDLEDPREIKKVVKTLAPYGVKFKIGPIAFTKFGPEFVKNLIKQGADIFLDLKLYDIPNTMKRTAGIITAMGCWSFTVHVAAGLEALKEVKNEANLAAKKYKVRKPIIMGVTVLTSREADKAEVLKLAGIADQAAIDAVVASAKEAGAIKRKFPRLKIITPGIRPPSASSGDQKRVMTATAAFRAGADYIVVGRPILEQKDYQKAAQDVLST
jgi:orotidine-5'-phosphate decarboxylase